ncbi:hypothetical protein N510_002985 [Firmicutes bacterium ASF500]|nr:hypothetical protein N510_002985 [Firmicutes bacterium ASF500]
MMNKLARRLLSAALSGVLMAGMCMTASAFTFPQAFWPLQQELANVRNTSDPDQYIAIAEKMYEVFSPYELCKEVCENMQFVAKDASWACEIKGDIDGAIMWAERQYTYSKWLTDNGIYDYTNSLLRLNLTRMDYLQAAKNVTVYAQTNNTPSPYKVGPRTGSWFGSAVDGTKANSNYTLAYINTGDSHSLSYWLNYWKNNCQGFEEVLNGGVVELAWNITDQSTNGVRGLLNSDSYIQETLQTIGSEMKDATVLLRVGAEMNNWDDSDPEVFKQAFQKVAAAARSYNNIQMVFSPNDISNMAYTIDQYYPGDEYVDWVGMSTYHSTNFRGFYGEASYSMSYEKAYDDSFYGMGVYDHDPITTIKPIVELARAHNKPVMISECGFSYIDHSTGVDMTAYAAGQMNFFYSYVNMVYPEVKAVFYFDVARQEGSYDYALAASPTLSSTYDAAIKANGTYLYNRNDTVTGWETLDKPSLSGSEKTLRLAAFASLPGNHSTTVKYYVDGNLAHTADKAPYYYDMPLTPGTHTVRAEAEGGQFKQSSQTYTVQVGGGTAPDVPVELPDEPVDLTPVEPAETAEALPSTHTLKVNGTAQAPTVYNINGYNYFKIRDLAAALNGTSKQFEVGYDGDSKSVTATTGAAYTVAGGELAGAASSKQTATVSKDIIIVNGEKMENVSVYNIDGYNYFQLRDLGKVLGFEVEWSAEEQSMIINTEG